VDNQRFLVWGLFLAMLWFAYQSWQLDYSPQTPPEASEVVDTAKPPSAILPPPGDEPLPAVSNATKDAAAPSATTAPERTVTVSTDVLDVVINTAGVRLVRATMKNYPISKDTPDELVELLSPDAANFGEIRLWLRGSGAAGELAAFEVDADRYELGTNDDLRVPFRRVGDNGITETRTLVFRRGAYRIDVEQTIDNGSDAAWRGDQVIQLIRRFSGPDRSMFNPDTYSFDGPILYNGDSSEKLDRDDLLDDGPEVIKEENGWVASIQHHFLNAIVPDTDTTNAFQVSASDNRMTASVVGPAQTVEPGSNHTFTATLFTGPKLQGQLEAIDPRLKLTVDYGLLTPLSQPMFWLLSKAHDFASNWGLAIIIVTILIKLVFYKLTESSGRSMAKMRELQPRMKALQERYKDDRQALSQQMMDLYKKEKINPAAGCLPILVQMPFFLAFYWVLVESVEMRQAPFFGWLTDLSSRDPFFILPAIMGGAMLLQQRLNPAPTDPVQARVMQILPVVFTVMFAFFPAGLVLYWATNTILSIAQQWKINKVVAAESKQRGKKKGKKATD